MGTRYGFNVTIGADTNPFSQALKKLNAPIKEAQQELEKINKALKLDPTNANLIKNAHSELATQILESKNKVQDLQKALDVLNQEERENGSLSTEQIRLRRSIESEIEIENKKIKDLTKEYKTWGGVTSQQIKAVGTKMQTLGSQVEAVGRSLQIVSGLATGALVGIVKTSMDFEHAWTGVTKTVDGTDEELNNVRESILSMSKATGISKNEIAGVAQVAGQLGIKVNDISDFTKVMVDLGVATDLSAEESATTIAKIANITGMTIDEYARFGASLTALGNNFATQESNILDMATRLASTGDLVGLTEPQILALSTALNSLGAEAESGGTAMSKMFRKMKLSIETGDKNLAKFAKVSGMSVKEFKQAFEKDALGALNAFVRGLGDIENSGGSAVKTLDDMKLSEVRLSDNLLKLVTSEGMLDSALDVANTGWEENTALTKEANKRYEETQSKLGKVKETLGDIAVDLGDILLPKIQKVLETVQQWIDKFNNLDDSQKKIILTILGIVAVLSPLLIIVGKFITFIGQIAFFAPAITSAFSGMAGGISAILGPIGIAVAIIAGLVAGFIALYNNSEKFRSQVEDLKATIINVYNTYIKPAIDDLKAMLNSLWNEILVPLLKWIFEALEPKITAVTERIFGVIEWVITGIGGLIRGLTSILKGIVDFIAGVFTGDWTRAWEGIKEIFGGIWTAMKGLAVRPLNWIIQQLNKFLQGLNKIKIPDWVPRCWW